MLTLPPSVKIFVAVEPVDARKSYDGLSAIVQSHFGHDILCGHLFAFIDRRPERSTFYIQTHQEPNRVSVAPTLRKTRNGGAAGPS